VTQCIVYLAPEEDLDFQRQRLQQRHPDCEVIEEHIGGWKAAEAAAKALRVPLLDASAAGTTQPTAPARERPQTASKRKKSQARYEVLRPLFRQARMLGLETPTEIAGFFNQLSTPLPSGKKGTWQPIQVKRALEWVGEVNE